MQEKITGSLELKLLLACSRWPLREADQQLIAELAREPLDWDRFLQLARHHRIVPIVARNLQSAIAGIEPQGAQNTLAELRLGVSRNAIRVMQLVGELRRVVNEFQRAGLGVRVLKGLPLAQQVFGDISLRAAGDLDLLIDGNQMMNADSILRQMGYSGLFAPDRLSPRQLAYYREHWKDFAYESPERNTAIDLHWRCFRNPKMPGQSLCQVPPGEFVSLGGLKLETMPRQHGLLYLCVHGTLDGWVYLKALVDVAAQVRVMPEQELDELARLAHTYGVKPELTATLLLVQRYFGMDCWSRDLLPEGDAIVRHILSYTARVLEGRDFLAPREAIPINETLRFEWGLRRSFSYRRELIARVLYRARMWEMLPLPDWLFWAYPLLSPVEWVLFRVRRAVDDRKSRTDNV